MEKTPYFIYRSLEIWMKSYLKEMWLEPTTQIAFQEFLSTSLKE